jgi:hypothetical protein
MKKIFWIVGLSVLSLSGFSQEIRCEVLPAYTTFCAEYKYGKLYMKHDGVVMENEVNLGPETVIHPEGVIETKDRFIVLKHDDCVRIEIRRVEPVSEPVAGNK